MARVYNFSAGPAVLPEEVLKEAADEMLDYKGSGMSVMEMSHRSKVYDNIIKEAEADLRELMNIPDNYKVLFLQGGASQQFAMIPMNLMKNRVADYIVTGQWAKKASQEASLYGKANKIASSEDKNYTSKNEMLDSLVGLLGGRVAEALVIGDVSTGASNDIERATEIARSMVTKYGMSDKLGPIAFGDQSNEVFLGKDFNHVRNYSESVASQIDEEIERIVKDAYSRTKEILSEHIDKLHAVAQALLKEEKIDGKEFEAIMKGEQQPAEAEPHPETAPEAAE